MYNTMSRASTITAPTITESRMASVRLAVAWSSTAEMTVSDALSSIFPAISLVVWIDWLRSGLLTSCTFGSDIMDIRLTISWASFSASGEPTPSTSLIPNSVDGSVPARVVIELRSSLSGSSPPRVTSSCCIIIWPRAPTARLRPCVWARIFTSSMRTEPVMASSAVSRIGAYEVTRSRSPMLLDATLLSSPWPPSSRVLTPVRTSVATSVSVSRCCRRRLLSS